MPRRRVDAETSGTSANDLEAVSSTNSAAALYDSLTPRSLFEAYAAQNSVTAAASINGASEASDDSTASNDVSNSASVAVGSGVLMPAGAYSAALAAIDHVR